MSMGGRTGNVMCDGTINTEDIYNAHRQVKELATSFGRVQSEMAEITATVRENWVGKGRNQFESQYNLLIRKIDDFGETLLDIYDALVQAEADYEAADDQIRQEFAMANQANQKT